MFPDKAPLLIILLIVLVIFGPTQLPKLAKTFGKSAKALKDGIDGTLVDDDDDVPKSAVAAATGDTKDE